MRRATRSPSVGRVRWLIAAAAVGVSGCGTLDSARMLAPGWFGMQQAAPGLYVEPAMDAGQRQELQRQIELGRARVAQFFGGVTTTPYFVACVTMPCSERFGSHGERATAFGDEAIRLTHAGLTAPLVAHEWTHAEVYRRAGGWQRVERIPRWFDEGLAVVIADEPRHSEDNWREIQRRGYLTPALTELLSRSDWIAAVRKYGETKVDDPDNLRLVYSTAGHEVRAWLACAGAPGVRDLLAAIESGEDFAVAYARCGGSCGR
jgi:hypothetical protein